MNNYFNPESFEEEKKNKSRLPSWIWIIAVIGLVVAVISGYFYGTESVAIYNEMMNEIIIKDTNGEDTSLTTLDFTGFIGVFDNEFGYNFFDCDNSFALVYNSTVKYNNAKGMYPNDFAGTDNVNYTVDFKNFNYYDLTYAKKAEKDVTFTFSSKLEKGNLEAVILRIDENYRVKETDYGTNIIEDIYLHEVARFSANKDETVMLPGGHIYVLAVGCESANGSYTFKAQ